MERQKDGEGHIYINHLNTAFTQDNHILYFDNFFSRLYILLLNNCNCQMQPWQMSNCSMQPGSAVWMTRWNYWPKAGAHPDRFKGSGQATSVHSAAWQGHPDILEALIAHGGDVNVRNAFKSTPLHFAAGKNHVECFKLLMGNGADLSAVNKQGKMCSMMPVSTELWML